MRLLIGLVVNLEAVGAKITYQNGQVKIVGNVPGELLRIARDNRDLLTRYYRLREKALNLQKAIDPEDEALLPPDHERLEMLELFKKFVEEAERLETHPLRLPVEKGERKGGAAA